MLTFEDAIISIPEDVQFEQVAPMMCTGATLWTAILKAGHQKGQAMRIVGIGNLCILGVQFAKALGYRIVAICYRDVSSKMASSLEALRCDLFVSLESPDTVDQIIKFIDSIRFDAVVVYTDSIPIND